jgi:hypothetical protein
MVKDLCHEIDECVDGCCIELFPLLEQISGITCGHVRAYPRSKLVIP